MVICLSVSMMGQAKMEFVKEAFGNEDYEAVVQQATELLKSQPKNVGALYYRSFAFYALGKVPQSLDDAGNAIKFWNKKCGYTIGELYYYRAQIYDAINDSVAAVSDFNTAVKKDKKNIECYIKRGNFYYDHQNIAAAEADFRTAHGMDKSNPEPQVELARCMLMQDKDAEASAVLDRVLLYEPQNIDAKRLRAYVYYRADEYKPFIDSYISYLDLNHRGNLDMLMYAASQEYAYCLKMVSAKVNTASDDGDRFFWLGVRSRVYQVKEQYDDALEDLDRMSEIVPDTVFNGFIAYQRANCYEGLYNYGKTAEILSELIARERAEGYGIDRSLFTRGFCYANMGEYGKAIVDFNEVINNKGDWAVLAYCQRGQCRYEMGAGAELAIEDFSKGLLLEEDNLSCLIMRGKLRLLELHDTIGAYQDFERILEIDTTLYGYTCRQYALMYMGRFDEAIEWMDKLLDADPSRGNYYDAACLYARMNRPDEAVQYFKTSLEKGYRAFYHIEIDDDLDSLRERDDFKEVLEKYRQKKVLDLFNKL